MGNWGEERDRVDSKLEKITEVVSLERAQGWERVMLERIKGDSEPQRIFRFLGSRPALKLWVSSFHYLRWQGWLPILLFIQQKFTESCYIVCEALTVAERHRKKDILSWS